VEEQWRSDGQGLAENGFRTVNKTCSVDFKVTDLQENRRDYTTPGLVN